MGASIIAPLLYFIRYWRNELRPYLMKGVRTHGKICYSKRIIRQAGVGVGA
jgi:hypothetical protein